MGKRFKQFNFWLRRRSRIPLVLIGGAMVALLAFNEDTSISLNVKYEKEIAELSEQIRLCRDSAQYFRVKREAILLGREDLEHLAREQYHMQRPTEDVYVFR